MDLVEMVYLQSEPFPIAEKFGLTSQLRRAAVSIPSNIAEGHGRSSDRDCARFLEIALGSLAELETQVLLAGRLHLLQPDAASNMLNAAAEVGRLLSGLLRSKNQ